MFIELKAKLRPYSTRPGIRCLVPYTSWEAQVFPTKVFLHNHETNEEKELIVSASSRKFLVMLDLEKGKLLVNGKELPLKKGSLPPSKTRLFLGSHKKQDIEMILRREDMAEVFPMWVRLAQLIPEAPLPSQVIGTMQLLEEGALKKFFLTGLQGMFCPRFHDENYLGIIEEVTPPESNPLGLLHWGARLIEQLFFRIEGDQWHILPALPKEFHTGRYLHLHTPEGDTLHLEWSKKQIKKIEIRPNTTRKVQLKLKKGVKSFRVRKSLRHKGEQVSSTLSFVSGQTLYLDRFTSRSASERGE